MKTVFLTNYFNHHQRFLANALMERSDSFWFVSTSEMREERRNLGYGETKIPEYVFCLHADQDSLERNLREIVDADWVLIGSAPDQLIRKRIKNSKLIFRYSERPFKRKDTFLKYIPRYLKWHFQNPSNKPIYMLCASAFTSYDYSRYHLFEKRFYKWGYFPETKRYPDVRSMIVQKDAAELLWCGRFLDWKHPELALETAARLKKDGYSFTMNLIGMGEMEETMRTMIREHDLDDCMHLLGTMKPQQVREHMERASIFLFTSDRQEGWGAVLNESMNSGCAVVASHAVGAVPYLLKDGENGLVFASGDADMLYEKVKYLLDHPDERQRMGEAAYRTIVEEWNAETAAERLVNLAEHILAGEASPELYTSGPCSKAERISEDWFLERE